MITLVEPHLFTVKSKMKQALTFIDTDPTRM